MHEVSLNISREVQVDKGQEVVSCLLEYGMGFLSLVQLLLNMTSRDASIDKGDFCNPSRIKLYSSVGSGDFHREYLCKQRYTVHACRDDDLYS